MDCDMAISHVRYIIRPVDRGKRSEAVKMNNSSVFFQMMMYVMNQSIIQEDNSYNYYYLNIGKGRRLGNSAFYSNSVDLLGGFCFIFYCKTDVL